MSGIETNNVMERLRLLARGHRFDAVPVVTEAADEIERLRTERQSLSDRIDVLEGENARLREDAEVGRKLRLGELPFQQPTGVPGQC